MRALPLPLALVIATMSASADHCVSFPVATPEFDSGHTAMGRFYIDNDLCQLECAYSIWVYEETNGIDGLQRGDPIVDDTCHGLVRADTIVWGEGMPL